MLVCARPRIASDDGVCCGEVFDREVALGGLAQLTLGELRGLGHPGIADACRGCDERRKQLVAARYAPLPAAVVVVVVATTLANRCGTLLPRCLA